MGAVWTEGPGSPRAAWTALTAHGMPRRGDGVLGFLTWLLAAIPKVATAVVTTAGSYLVALAQVPGGLVVLAFVAGMAWLVLGGAR